MKLFATFILTSSLALAAQQAHASTVDIVIPYTSSGSVLYSNQWSNAIQGGSIITAPTNGNQGGPTFTNWAGQFNGTGSGATTTISFSGLPILGNASSVNALMDTFFGSYYTVDAVVTFTNSLGASESYDLIGAETIRDYYNNLSSDYSNLLSGSNTAPPDPGVVTATNWWNNYGNNPAVSGVRLDEQTFYLPGSWAGSTLTSMTIADNVSAGSGTEINFSALQLVDASTTTSATPEPSSIALFGTGLAALAGAARRKLRKS